MKSADLDPRSSEVDEEANFDSGCVEVVDHLRLVLRRERPYGLHLDEDYVVDDEISLEMADDLTSEADFERALGGDFQAFLAQSDDQGGVIDGLQKSVTELVCDLEAQSDDPLRELFMRPARLCLLRVRGCSWKEHELERTRRGHRGTAIVVVKSLRRARSAGSQETRMGAREIFGGGANTEGNELRFSGFRIQIRAQRQKTALPLEV